MCTQNTHYAVDERKKAGWARGNLHLAMLSRKAGRNKFEVLHWQPSKAQDPPMLISASCS
eukprot:1161346-Pelagomonas_calceolata.AAC.13